MKKSTVESLEEIRKNTPLNTSIEVMIRFQFMDLIHKLGYRDHGPWGDDEIDKLRTIIKESKSLSDSIVKVVNEKQS